MAVRGDATAAHQPEWSKRPRTYIRGYLFQGISGDQEDPRQHNQMQGFATMLGIFVFSHIIRRRGCTAVAGAYIWYRALRTSLCAQFKISK
uniref:Uncharacterized protein n=1 Tax=Arundo donax TaxID=35708 RepID=A0A0A9HSG4_ARUDO